MMRINVQASESHFGNLAEDLWCMLREMQGRNCFRSDAAAAWQPRVNVYESANAVVICAELAGVSPEELNIEFDRGVLHIRGSRPRPSPDASAGVESGGGAHFGVYAMEIDSGPFHRAIDLGARIDADSITASFRQGYLWVLAPRG